MTEVIIVRITTSKSKNSESFYIAQSYTNAKGKCTSKTVRKLGTLAELSAQFHTDCDGVVEWANEFPETFQPCHPIFFSVYPQTLLFIPIDYVSRKFVFFCTPEAHTRPYLHSP